MIPTPNEKAVNSDQYLLNFPEELLNLPGEMLEEKESDSTSQVTKKKKSRAYITELNCQTLAFIGTFPGVTAEALSMIRHVHSTTRSNVLPSVQGVEKLLKKMYQLKAIDRYRNRATGTTHYGITEDGIYICESFGYNTTHYRGISNLSIGRLNHYAMIAHVAAQITSPREYFRPSLIPRVPLERLVSENAMRAAYEEAKQEISHNPTIKNFTEFRNQTIKSCINDIRNNKLAPSDMVEFNPVLYTIGADKFGKNIHQPDLVVNLDGMGKRREVQAKNILIEVELNRKDFKTYENILNTFAYELKHGFVYNKIVYFTTENTVINLLHKADTKLDLGLFESGKLTALKIVDRDGATISRQKRVTVPAKKTGEK